jgi:hypothetical protein
MQCCGYALVSLRIRIQGAKPMIIHADTDPDQDPGQTFKSQKFKFLHLSRLK